MKFALNFSSDVNPTYAEVSLECMWMTCTLNSEDILCSRIERRLLVEFREF